MRTLRQDLLLACVLLTIGVLGRWVAHTPNATPVAAAAMLAGFTIGRRWMAMLVPLTTLGLSDLLFEGGYEPAVMVAVYGTMGLIALRGHDLGGSFLAGRVLAGSLLASLLFFLTTNLAVWATGQGYAPTWAGLLQCYTNAVPFLWNTVRGDLFWSVVLFGGLGAIEWVRGLAGLRAVTVPAEATP